jgi:hypothetical protein
LSEQEAYVLLNHEVNLTTNGNKSGTLGKATPLPANYLACDMEMPAGENYSVGSHYAPLTNESYNLVYNSNRVDFLSRINGDGTCQIVHYSDCFKLSADPKHYVADWRAMLRVEHVCPNRDGKYFVFTDGSDSGIFYIDVEASIATDNFTTPFFERCADPCAYIKLCVPDPCGCLQASFIPLPASEVSLTNKMVDVGIQLMFKHIYYDGRESEWGDRSTTYYQDSKGCFDDSEGFPRCLRVRVPVGNPMVEKIKIAFTDNGKTWYLYDTVDKYKKYNSSQQKWYERDLAELLNYSDEDCAFDYIFCNDKQKLAIDPVEISRVNNPIPREVQGFIPIKDALGFYNYKLGNCPVDKFQIDKFNIEPVCNDSNCQNEFATITVRAIIHNYNAGGGRNEFIYRLGGDASNSPDDVTDTAFFGGLNESLGGGLQTGFDQRFNDKTRNFIVYVEGYSYYAEMKQWKAHAFFNSKEEWGTIGNMDDVNTRNRWRRAARNGEFFYQEAKIKVPKGTKGSLRLVSHHATTNDTNTSTFVVGTVNLLVYKGDADLTDVDEYDVVEEEEIEFDTCNGDLDLTRAFIIQDYATSGLAASFSGYLKDEAGVRQEGMLVATSKTDHNGFYHFGISAMLGDSIDVNVLGELNCADFQVVKVQSLSGQEGTSTELDIIIDNPLDKTNFYAIVKAKVQDCNGQGIGGLRVALTGSKFKITDAFGVATFRIRNYSTRDRVITAIVINNNDCVSVDCADNCNPCMPSQTSSTPACYDGNPVVTLSPLVINIASILTNRNGLKLGGRYAFAILAQGDCGMISAAYGIKYIDIPRAQQRNDLSFCGFNYNGNGITFPPGFKCLKILRSVNLNPFELQWIVDKIERTTDGKIKLTIQSLNDYNKKYNFKTNTIYQWLKNDRVEFIRNGDGNIFSIAQFGLLNYQTISPFNDETISGVTDSPADFFNQLLIEDDGKLDSLTEGAIIELQRPKSSTTEILYYEICVSIEIGPDGKLLVDSGTFNTFDTYLVPRTIGALPSQLFEHHSPSDFWGDRMTDTGKAHIANEFETEKRYGRNVSVNSSTIFNRFGDLVKTFDSPEQGDITFARVTDSRIGIAGGENDNFLFQVSDDLARVGGDGIIRAASPDSVISDGEPKVVGRFGCQYDSIGSVYFGDGFTKWVDTNRQADVSHDYNQAVDISDGKTKTYFRKFCQDLRANNKAQSDFLNHYRFITGWNESTKAVILTTKSLRHSGINNDDDPMSQKNCTILYNPASNMYLGYAGYCAESYSNINLSNDSGCAFIAYLNGSPYIHPVISDRYLEFFGIGVDWKIGISINKYPEKIKRPISNEVQSQILWFARNIETEMANFKSEIPAKKWTKSEDKFNAPFLGNINSRSGLYGDEGARGFFIKVLYIRDNTDGLKYNTIDNNKRLLFSTLDNILTKFAMSEESGFTENL